MKFIKEVPNNINELVKKANDKNHWEVRLEALNELKQYDCRQTRDVVTRLALHDRVFNVKQEAFKIAQALEIKINEKPIFLGKKDIGYKESDFTKTFLRIKKECKIDKFDITIFKEKFIQVNPEMYDVMSNEKGLNFDKWIENKFKTLPKNK